MWPFFLSVINFCKCDPFCHLYFQVWAIWMWLIFPNVTHFLKCYLLLQVWPFLPSVTHFSNCDPFFQMWLIFPNVTHFSKCDEFFQIWPIFPNVTHSFQCDPLFQMWPIFPSVTYCSKWDPFFKCCLLFQMWLIFPLVLENGKESLSMNSRGLWSHSFDTANQVWLGSSNGPEHAFAAMLQFAPLVLWSMQIQRSLWL